jgi:VIT1/CCC1 family predicted Fe2+/Mn2+ transporter
VARQAVIRKKRAEAHAKSSKLRDFILGWQDGMVNVLGVILGVVAATGNAKLVLIAALAAACAESISMAAVAYTAFTAENDFYISEVNREKREMEEMPDAEKDEVRDIYKGIGFKGALLEQIVKHITASKKRWLDVMMFQELRLFPLNESPRNISVVVGISAFSGALILIVPFLFIPVKMAMWVSLALAAAILFIVGAYKAITTVGNPIRNGLEMTAIGMLAALAGYLIGSLLGVVIRG